MKTIVAWFARNHVAANLLMFVMIIGGLLTLMNLKKEIFPEFSADIITVSVVYPGASPEEVEESICVRVEEQIQGLSGIRKISSTATEGVGAITVEAIRGVDLRQLLDDVKARVDAIDTFPDQAEKPIVQEALVTRQVVDVAISGDADETSLKRLGEQVRDEIAALDGITLVEMSSARPYEISIEISERDLRQHGLSFDQVVAAVRAGSLDLPGGSIKTDGGEILLRTKGQAYRGRDFEDVVLLTHPDGTRLLLGDVATVIDGFEDIDKWARFDGQPTVMLSVFRVGDQNALQVADAVMDYIDTARAKMPEGVELTTWRDGSKYLRDRIDLLMRNGRTGLFLVFLVLALFLRFRLAFWVSLGIPLSFLGAVWLMPTLGVSINLISVFAFILVLGIVVDDAIVVGENIYSHLRRGKSRVDAVIDGTQEVAVPVIFAVLTTVAAFLPLTAVPGTMGKIWRVIPLIVIPTLLFSIIESQLILPAHLMTLNAGNGKKRRGILGWWKSFQSRFSDGLEQFILRIYKPSLEFGLRNRYLTLAVALATLAVTIGLVGGGFVKFVFFPPVEADTIAASLTMPQGTPAETTAAAVRRIETAALALQAELEEDKGANPFRHVLTSVGEQPFSMQSGPMASDAAAFTGAHLGEVQVELVGSEDREMGSTEIAQLWRERVGPIADAVELSFTASLFNAGAAIDVQLASADLDQLQSAAAALRVRLADYAGVIDITDTYRAGKQEVKLSIKPSAEALGLSMADLARQVRFGFYGAEAQRIQRGRDDLKVMVRYPEEDRRSLGDLENMRIRTPMGSEVPFSTVASASMGRGYASIRRVDRQRVISVTADVDQAIVTPNEIVAALQSEVLPQLLADFPNVRYSFEGEQREQRDALSGLARGFLLALFLIYALMAIPFKSYLQPLIVMTAIPYGLVGAVWGHVLMGKEFSILSLMGMVALAGVVVNDSLVLVDFINRRRRAGLSTAESVREAGVARFRPILLTSLTTFVGLTPILLEKSLQAQFLIPMAISLAFGVMFSTFITLMIVPSSYLILEDLVRLVRPRSRTREQLDPEIRIA